MLERIRFFREQVLQINENNFDEIALGIFRYQAAENPVYAGYLKQLGIAPESVSGFEQIPFLPIRFFRSHQVRTGKWHAETVFRSSGTTGAVTSVHQVDDADYYRRHSLSIFNRFFGLVEDINLIAVLPSYTERGDSSLVHMVDWLVRCSGSPVSGFFPPDPQVVSGQLERARSSGRPTVVIGVTFALLDLAAAGIDFSGVTIIETGGMKGRRKEIIREELHELLQAGHPSRICSEYGMTELLSQAYAMDGRLFRTPPSMRVMFREINDPFSGSADRGQGIILVADLANVHSCCFIETQDLGKGENGGFEVLGRVDHSDVRGCSLLSA